MLKKVSRDYWGLSDLFKLDIVYLVGGCVVGPLVDLLDELLLSNRRLALGRVLVRHNSYFRNRLNLGLFLLDYIYVHCIVLRLSQ